jgi:parallel beta-helix repeat protein
MWGIILLVVGILIICGIAYFYRDKILSYFKKNKKQIIAAGTGLAVLTAGGSSLITPEGYRPPGVLVPYYDQDTAPSVNDNRTAWWYDTDDSLMNLVVNTWGTTYTFVNYSSDWEGGASDGYIADGNIHNSNGNSYTVSQANLVTALSDVGNNGWVTVGGSLTLTSALVFNNNYVTLDFMGNAITLTGDIGFINITACIGSTVRNAEVNVNTHTSNIIKCDGFDWNNRVDFVTVEDIFIDNIGSRSLDAGTGLNYYDEHNYTGLCLTADSGGTTGRVDSCVFRNIEMEGAGIGIHVDCFNSGYVNGNHFENIYLDEFEEGVVFDETGVGDANQNVFTNLKTQVNPITTYGIKDVHGNGNHFKSLLMWDWDLVNTNPNGVYAYWIGSAADGTIMEIHDSSLSDFESDGRYFDEGYDTTLIAGFGHYYDRHPYDFIVWQNSTHTFVQNGKYGIIEQIETIVNSRTALNSIFSTHDSNPCSIFIKDGTYEFDTFLSNPNLEDVTFIGESKHNVVFKPQSGVAMTSGLINIDGEHNITFRNICFDGSDAITHARGLYIGNNANTHNVTVDNCVFRHFDVSSSSCGIYSYPHSDDTVNNLRVIDCTFIGNYDAIVFVGDADPSYVDNCMIEGNYFEGNTNDIELTYVRNTTVVHNQFVDGDGVNEISNCENNIIKDNVGYNDATWLIVPDESVETERFLRYDDTANELEIWDDSTWVEFGPSSGDGFINDGNIHNSNGNNWTATAANLQAAVDDLDNTTGWVDVPNGTITLTTSLLLGTGCWLRGQGRGTVLTQANSQNITLVKNYDSSGGNDDITITGIRFEGNGLNQPEWWQGSNAWWKYHYAIFTQKTNNMRIENCFFNNSGTGDILIYKSRNLIIVDNYFSNTAKLYEDSGNDYTHWQANAIYPFNCSNVVIANNVIDDVYNAGIVIESNIDATYETRNFNNVVSNNVVYEATFGIYAEDVRDSVWSGNTFERCNDTTIYGYAAGIRVSPASCNLVISDTTMDECFYGVYSAGTNITFSNIISSNALATSASAGDFFLPGDEQTLINCKSFYSDACGFYVEGENTSLIGCESVGSDDYGVYFIGTSTYGTFTNSRIEDCTTTAFLGTSDFLTITDNVIHNPGSRGIEVQGENGTISGNKIFDSASNEGIRLNGGINYTIINNFVIDCYWGIREQGAADYNRIHYNVVDGYFSSQHIVTAGSNTELRGNTGNTNDYYSNQQHMTNPAAPSGWNIYVDSSGVLVWEVE